MKHSVSVIVACLCAAVAVACESAGETPAPDQKPQAPMSVTIEFADTPTLGEQVDMEYAVTPMVLMGPTLQSGSTAP